MGTQRIENCVGPATQFDITLAEKWPDEGLKSLSERRIGDITLVLVEFADREQSARRYQRLVDFIDN